MMHGTTSQRQEFHPLPRMIPEQIIAGEILQLSRMELEQRIEMEFERNPALTIEASGLCPVCDAPVDRLPCPSCGYSPAPEDDVPVVLAEDWETYRQRIHDAEGLEPFMGIAARQTLRDHLQGQWLVQAEGEEFRVGEYIIELLDEDGYLLDPLIEIADRFRLSVPQVEVILRRVQALDPPGIGATSLQECLLLQCERFEADEAVVAVAGKIIRDAWDDLAAARPKAIVRKVGASAKEVEAAIAWVRGNLIPYPGRAYRDAWESLSPRREPRVTPDAIIRPGPEGFIVEIVESLRVQLAIDPEYQRLCGLLKRRNGVSRADCDHINRSVSTARYLIDALAQRRRTLHRVMTAVAEAQAEFLRHGRSHLRPLLQKTIAADLGIHESTVCRALADKMVSIPSGETIPASHFFDASAPAKEALQEIIAREDRARPLSDAHLAQLLTEGGFPIARRTVAKYRDALRIPSVEERRSMAAGGVPPGGTPPPG